MRLPLLPTLLLPALLLALPLTACNSQPSLPAACELKPESGRCRAAITRYFFEPAIGECRAFIWGGCDGVVPFETFEDCHSQCRPGVPLPERIPGGKSGAVPDATAPAAAP
ncbi:MAG: BPTI/Kunitz domain-containing protein [Gammaproteobacteria bacterium]